MTRSIPSSAKPSQEGAVVALAAAPAAGDAIPPHALLLVSNGSASPITLTFVTPATVGAGLAVADQTATVEAGAMKLFGPFSDDHFRQNTGTTKGRVHVDYSSVTTVTRAVIG